MPSGSVPETSTLTTPESPPAPSAPQLVLRGEDLQTSLSSWSPPVSKELNGQAQNPRALRDSGCCLIQPQSTTPLTWRTWCAAARMLAPLTTTQTRRIWLSWCAVEGNPRTLTLLGAGTSPLRTDAISSATKACF